MDLEKLILPEIEEPLEFSYDRSSIRKFTRAVFFFSILIVVGFGLLISGTVFSEEIDRGSVVIGILCIVVFGGIVTYQMLNIFHFKDVFLFTREFASVTNPKREEIKIHWDNVDCIKLSIMEDEIHILGEDKKILMDESLPNFDLFLEYFGLNKSSKGGPTSRWR